MCTYNTSSVDFICCGAVFAYEVLFRGYLSSCLNFKDLAVPQITAASVVSMTVGIVFWLGAICEMPIVMFLLAKIGLLNSRWLKTKRRWVILLAFVFGAAVLLRIQYLR
ncbi:MAG: hypothetical protein CM1200mP39_10950 [Dehalococcoidia bacterium]|nr:MAG: hypothetical protein CM1200mP39_10950 [Dehalococcoidia bacterium]